jgi:thiol:disulfide interchange protein
MRRALLLTALLLPSLLPGAELPAYSRGYSAERDPFADGRAALALATQTGRRVLIEVGGDWCVWCHVLDRLVREQAALGRALHDHYVLLKVSVSDANDNADFLAGLPPLTGYPRLYVTRANGQVIHAQDPSAFLQDGTYDPDRVLAFLQRWAPPEDENP